MLSPTVTYILLFFILCAIALLTFFPHHSTSLATLMGWWWFRVAFLVCILVLVVPESWLHLPGTSFWSAFSSGSTSSVVSDPFQMVHTAATTLSTTVCWTLGLLLAIVYVASANVELVRRAAATE